MTDTKVLFVRSLPLERDSRSTKMVTEYRRRGYSVFPLIWSRGDAVDEKGDALIFNGRGGYGQRLLGIGARVRWMKFIATRMISRRHDFDMAHVVDFDTAIIAVPIGRLLGKVVIYDAFDSIGAIAGGGVLGAILSMFERWWMQAASIIIFPDPIRLKQYRLAETSRTAFIGNIPDSNTAVRELTHSIASDRQRLKLVYIGTLEADHRGLEFIPEICTALSNKIEFIVGGTGQLDELFSRSSDLIENLTYVGHQNYDGALRLMHDADILYGPYLLSSPAHRYASPNKMYEHLILAKPLLTNTGTPPGALVERAGSGFLFDGTLQGLMSLLKSLNSTQCRAAGVRAQTIWETEFAALRKTQLDRFFSLLRSMKSPSKHSTTN